MKVLVTGGSGFVGQNLQKVRPDWIYPTSGELNLYDMEAVRLAMIDYAPDAIVHLAARVGGIAANTKHPAVFLQNNVRMNANIFAAAQEYGIHRVLSSISTCAWPDKVDQYPFDETDLHDGPPAETNFGYGYAKRLQHVTSAMYSRQWPWIYNSTFAPCNIYGPHDNFDEETSHFIPALIRRLSEAQDGDVIELWGTGAPLRQQMYAPDLAEIIPMLLEKHMDTEETIIVAPNNNASIKEIAQIAYKVCEKDVIIEFNGDKALNGQHRKDGDNGKLIKLIGDFEFTGLEEGLRKTYEWYQGQ